MFEPRNLKRWTMPSSYFGASWPNHYSAGVGQSRDSDCLEVSNFVTTLKLLGGESDVVTVVRESHWAVGWVEWIAIHQDDDKALQIADDIQDKREKLVEQLMQRMAQKVHTEHLFTLLWEVQ
jgi:hypothetical protein